VPYDLPARYDSHHVRHFFVIVVDNQCPAATGPIRTHRASRLCCDILHMVDLSFVATCGRLRAPTDPLGVHLHSHIRPGAVRLAGQGLPALGCQCAVVADVDRGRFLGSGIHFEDALIEWQV
jgi:hypothetical protein